MTKTTKGAWSTLLVTMFCYLFFYTGRHNFGWATTGIISEFGVSHEAIGWVSFSMLIGYALGQLINGNLADRLSPKWMIAMGGLLSVMTNVAISFLHAFEWILILWTLNGYFQSMAWSSGSKLISNWWKPEHRGKAYGFYTMAAGSSSVLTFGISIMLVQGEAQWRDFFRYPVILLLLAVIVFMLIVKDKPEEEERVCGDEKRYESNPKSAWYHMYQQAFSNRSFLLASIGIGFQSMARYGLIFWVPMHFLGTHYKESAENLWLVVLLPIGMALGAVVFGQASDRIFRGNRPLSIRLGMSVCAILAWLMYYLQTDSYFIIGILMLLIGFFVYGPQANFWSLVPDILGTRLVGTGTGIMNMFAYGFAAIGEPFLGYIIDYTGDSAVVFLVIGCICMCCLVTMLFIKTKNVK